MSRWCDDVVDYRPDVLSILVGVNDLTRHLDRIGYRGIVGCEYRPLGRTEDGLGWMKEVA